MLDDCENRSASCCETRLEPSPILTKVSAAGVGTTPGEGPETQRTHCRTGEGASRRPEEDRRARKANHRLRATARAAQAQLHQFFQAPFLRWFGRGAETARPQAQKPTQTRRPTRTPGAPSPSDSHGRGGRPESAPARKMRALRAQAAAKARSSDYRGGATTASGNRDSGDPTTRPSISVPRWSVGTAKGPPRRRCRRRSAGTLDRT